MPPRNSAVARGLLTDTTAHTVYTVPAGSNLIFKNLLANQQSGAAVTVTVLLHDPSSGTYILGAVVTDTAGVPGVWSGWVVLNGGDQIILQASVADTYYWISGAVLPFA